MGSNKQAGDVMKRYIRREYAEEGPGFGIYDETGMLLYRLTQEEDKHRKRLYLSDTNDRRLAELMHKQLMVHYFTIRCSSGFYVLIPAVKECFVFYIYGSTYRFAGDIAAGRFSLFDVDKSPVMTQKKCWTVGGDGYEIELYLPEQEIFALCVALCAALYIAAAEESAVPSG
ncbi:MAG TPA: hypothetical protein DEO95_11475 [Ruminococcaceae bacterium]|nr:hypothetical protein [Oscillospiraceae bacterium]